LGSPKNLPAAFTFSVRAGEHWVCLVSSEQADNLKQMTNLLERFETQLTTLTSTLERVQASAIRLQTMDEATIRAEIPDLLRWIKGQSQELKGFEKQAG
jgi:archaellum component FlaC